jgi:hypothetical protein
MAFSFSLLALLKNPYKMTPEKVEKTVEVKISQLKFESDLL